MRKCSHNERARESERERERERELVAIMPYVWY
jgi:hypothetical protein